jgi:hypothetical protein
MESKSLGILNVGTDLGLCVLSIERIKQKSKIKISLQEAVEAYRDVSC